MTLRLLEAAVIAVAVVQMARIALKPPFRRDMKDIPLLAVSLGVLALTLTALGLWLMRRWPVIVDIAAVISVVGMAAAWWRARPSFGRQRGWPAGSLAVGASLDAIDDRDFYLDQSKIHGPVFKMSQFGRPVVCVVGLGRGRDLLQSNPAALTGASLPYNRFVPQGSLRYMAGDEHRREGPLFRGAFSSLELEPGEDVVRANCRDMLASLSADSRNSDDGVRAREYLGRWVFAALSRVFFGFEPTDPRVLELERAQRAVVLDRTGGRRWRTQMEWGFQTATDLIQERAREGAVMASGVVPANVFGALVAADPETLDSVTRVRNLFLIFRLGVGDVTSLLDWVVTKLTEHPEWRDKVRTASVTGDAPGESPSADIASRVILETLRMEQSEFLYRRVVQSIVFEGFTIPAGWLVRICVQESHRDPAIFPEPNRFDPDRFVGRTFGRAQYSPFGADNHGCLGKPLVNFLGRIFVEELCRGYHWRVTRDGPLERGTRHRHHWRPSAAKRIVLLPLGDGNASVVPTAAGAVEVPGNLRGPASTTRATAPDR